MQIFSVYGVKANRLNDFRLLNTKRCIKSNTCCLPTEVLHFLTRTEAYLFGAAFGKRKAVVKRRSFLKMYALRNQQIQKDRQIFLQIYLNFN